MLQQSFAGLSDSYYALSTSPEQRLRNSRDVQLRCHTIYHEWGYEMLVDMLEILKRQQDNGVDIWQSERRDQIRSAETSPYIY